MAKKKGVTEENVQAKENICELAGDLREEINNTTVGRGFPKQTAKAKIKSITREKDLVKVKFKDLVFTPGQEEQLVKWMDEEDEILVTLSLYQAKIS